MINGEDLMINNLAYFRGEVVRVTYTNESEGFESLFDPIPLTAGWFDDKKALCSGDLVVHCPSRRR